MRILIVENERKTAADSELDRVRHKGARGDRRLERRLDAAILIGSFSPGLQPSTP